MAGEKPQHRKSESLLDESTRLLTLTQEITVTVSRDGSLSATIQTCAELFVEYLDVKLARIWLLDAKDEAFELRASAGPLTRLAALQHRVPAGNL
jgi:hypothetical protein